MKAAAQEDKVRRLLNKLPFFRKKDWNDAK